MNKTTNTPKKLPGTQKLHLFLSFLLFSLLLFCLTSSLSCISQKGPFHKKSNLDLREKLNQLSQQITEKKNQIEDLKTENKILKTLIHQKRARKKKKYSPNPSFEQKNLEIEKFEFQKKNPTPAYIEKPFPSLNEQKITSFNETSGDLNNLPKTEKTLSAQKLKQDNSFLYSEALKAYHTSNFKQLDHIASLSLKHQPNNFYTDDILFLSGKLDAKKGLYTNSLQKLNQLIEEYANSNKKAAALLWKGVAYQKLNLKDPAHVSFKRLIREHPKSPEAHLARQKIKTLKK